MKIEKFIYNRDCLKSTFHKTFENMTSISEKLKRLEQELILSHKDEEDKHNLSDDGIEIDRKFFLDFSKTNNRVKSKELCGYYLYYIIKR